MLKKIILILIFFTIHVLPQNKYFVSENGNDDNDGLSEAAAFATLQHAADIAAPGDSVIVLEGTYTGFDIRTDGTENSPIVFKAMENVIINSQNSVTPDGINIENADRIVIDGFFITDQPRAGIRAVLSDFVVIKNNHCTVNYRWGIFTGFTDNILIENNICSYSEDEHGIYVSNSGDNPVVRFNHCFENNGGGIQLNADASMGGDGIISNAVIEGNILHDNGYEGGAAINLDCVQNSYIFNNLLYNNHASGIALFKIDGAEGSKNNKIYNNTIVMPSDGRWAVLINTGSTGNQLLNNILINNHNYRGSISIDESSMENFESDYNLVENKFTTNGGNSVIGLEEWRQSGYDLNSILKTDEENIFEDFYSDNFHLKENSEAIDKGTSVVSSIVTVDLDKNTRYKGNSYDIGAYEYESNITGINDKIIISEFELFQNYPNPFNPVTTIKYSIPIVETGHASSVQLKICDILGNEIITLINEQKSPGTYTINFDASGLPSGVYFYRLEISANSSENAASFIQTRKMILLK